MLRRVLAVAVLVAVVGPGLRAAPARADWPMFIGDGDRTPPKQGTELVDHLDDAPVLWQLDHHMGVGKGLYPGTLRYARDHGIEAFYGGTASPIVAGGTVYVTYFKPDGRVPAKRKGWRTMDRPENLALLPDWFFSVTADDCLLAVDSRTGEVRWHAVEEGKGHNRLGHKRNHWGVSPAWADGRVFSMGTAGRLYAYDGATGRKLWEVVARPSLLAQRHEYIEKRELGWTRNGKSSLVVAGGCVVVPHGGLTAFDAKTGERKWQIDEPVLSKHATPAFWVHGGKTYLVANGGHGTVRLIDPATGRVLWTHEGLGNQLGTVNVTGDLAILNAGSKRSADEKANGLFGAFRLSLKGMEHLWTLPDLEKYRHSWTMDRGAERRAAIQDGHVYLIVGLKKEDRLVVADAETGRIVAEESARGMQAPYPVEDRLVLYDDRAHTDPITASWWSLAEPGRPQKLHGSVGFPPRTITGYEVPIEWPCVDGILYGRTLGGLAAFDLRKPPETPANRTLHMFVPGDILGERTTRHVTLVQRDGRLTHGGFRGAPRLHAVDTSRAEWDGRKLGGTLGIDVEGFRRFGRYDVDATLGEKARLAGTITSRLPAFTRPIEVAGRVTAMAHQPAWMPPAADVLWLHEAVFQEGGRDTPGRLLLFVTHSNGRLMHVAGYADRTTRTPPVIDWRELTIENGRLKGVVKARYRADEWTQPLAETGTSAAGRYEVDAALGRPAGAEVGAYQGVYGADWFQRARLLALD